VLITEKLTPPTPPLADRLALSDRALYNQK
jgi:hypothetical protein